MKKKEKRKTTRKKTGRNAQRKNEFIRKIVTKNLNLYIYTYLHFVKDFMI